VTLIPFNRLAASYPTLANVSPALATELLAAGRSFSAAPRDVLFDTGAPCAGLPLVLGGTVRVSRPLANGQEVTLYRLGPGELCALSLHALLGHAPHVARAQAENDVHGVLVPAEIVTAALDADATFRHHVLSTLASRLGTLVAVVEQVSVVRLDERLARLLTERGPVLTITHQALADELGTAREVVSRILEAFATRGAVRLRRGRVEVLDRSLLGPAPRTQARPPAEPVATSPLQPTAG
jgi:CRP/FNR family transcriptional regulator